MFIQLDKQNMEIQVICGILEDYKPDENIKEINDKVKNLREKMNKFMAEEVLPSLKSIEAKIKEQNDKYIVAQGE